MFPLTKLRAVRDWGWHRYVVKYYRDEEHYDSGTSPLLVREVIESEKGIDRWVFGCAECPPEGGWPTARYGAELGYAYYERVEANVESRLRFVPGRGGGGTEVLGAGWLTPLPPEWLGR